MSIFCIFIYSSISIFIHGFLPPSSLIMPRFIAFFISFVPLWLSDCCVVLYGNDFLIFHQDVSCASIRRSLRWIGALDAVLLVFAWAFMWQSDGFIRAWLFVNCLWLIVSGLFFSCLFTWLFLSGMMLRFPFLFISLVVQLCFYAIAF